MKGDLDLVDLDEIYGDENEEGITGEELDELGDFEKEQRQLLEEEQDEDIITIIIDKVGKVSFVDSDEMNLIATDSEKQKSGNSLQHKAAIRDTLLRNYIEPIPTMMIDPNTIWKPTDLYLSNNGQYYLRCMIIQAKGPSTFEAIGELLINAFQVNLAQAYKHLGRTLFLEYSYDKTLNKHKYEDSPETHDLPRGEKLTWIRKLEVEPTITSDEPVTVY